MTEREDVVEAVALAIARGYFGPEVAEAVITGHYYDNCEMLQAEAQAAITAATPFIARETIHGLLVRFADSPQGHVVIDVGSALAIGAALLRGQAEEPGRCCSALSDMQGGEA